MKHKNIIEKPDYEAAYLHLLDIQALLKEGFKPVWQEGELRLE